MTLEVKSDPFELFEEWYEEASGCESIKDASAVTLATVEASGMPDARVVLVKDYGPDGFVFYTNLGSAKARQLEGNPRACLCYSWLALGKQVRIQGATQLVSEEEADVYFASRPLASQLGAWASKQSAPLASRDMLLRAVAEYAEKFAEKVPRPPFWSGYRLVPERIEYWLHQPSRLHDRLVYTRSQSGVWSAETLYP